MPTLLKQPESHRALLIDHECDRVGQDSVLKNDWVANCRAEKRSALGTQSGLTPFSERTRFVLGRNQVMQTQDEAILCLNFKIFALVSEEFGVVSIKYRAIRQDPTDEYSQKSHSDSLCSR